MSSNLVEEQSENYFTHTRDFAIITTDSQQVSDVKAMFDKDWNYNCPNNTNSTPPPLSSSSPLVVSPVNSRSVLTELINNAQRICVKEILWATHYFIYVSPSYI